MGEKWRHIGPPLRPSPSDLSFVAGEVARWASDYRPPRALILGVTPEFYQLPWPTGSTVTAIDHTQAMIEALWPGPRHRALCAEWTEMPLPAVSLDLALCDGGLTLLRHPRGHQKLVSELHRVLVPGGCFIARLFVPAPRKESPAEVLSDLLNNRISSLDIFKLRLWMSLQQNTPKGVRLDRVWKEFHAVAPDLEELAGRTGWTLETVRVMETFRDSPDCLYFVTVDQARHLFCEDPGGFELSCQRTPDYELGERCPTLVFRRKQ